MLMIPVSASAFPVPVKATIRIELDKIPERDYFFHFLVFKDYESSAVLVKFHFHKTGNLLYEAVVDESTPQELAKLQGICRENNRDFWDMMTFENRQSLSLSIKNFFLEITYNSTTAGCINEIAVVDWEINQDLAARYAKIYLNDYARFSRLKWVKEAVKKCINKEYVYDANTSPVFFAAVRDIGKCGTSSYNLYGMNPKYGSGSENLCSEFVSWYYHNEGIPFGRKIFRDVYSNIHLMDLFSYEGRKYSYNNTTQQFEHTVTGEVYNPQPGDYLQRENQGHAMIMAGWNDETNTAAVINGPWPVTIRKVEIQKDEDRSDKEYFIGRVNDLVLSNPYKK